MTFTAQKQRIIKQIDYIGIGLFFIWAVMITVASSTSCNHVNNQDIPDVVYKARAFNGLDFGSGKDSTWYYDKNGDVVVAKDSIKTFDVDNKTYLLLHGISNSDTTKITSVKDSRGTEMFNWYLIDTTKPTKIKVNYNHYKLEGSDTLFQMLWLQVQSPVDVTPRSLQLLKNWLQSSIKIDSTIKQ